MTCSFCPSCNVRTGVGTLPGKLRVYISADPTFRRTLSPRLLGGTLLLLSDVPSRPWGVVPSASASRLRPPIHIFAVTALAKRSTTRRTMPKEQPESVRSSVVTQMCAS